MALLREKWGDSHFLDLYSKLLNNLKLEVDLKYKSVKDIKSKIGLPQGCKVSCMA